VSAQVDVLVEDPRWEALGDLEALAAGAVEAALGVARDAPAGPLELSLMLADDAALQALNRDWRGKDRPTNVLSFPAPPQEETPGPRHLGDIAMAYETLAREAEQDGKSLTDHALHLIVHGTLHLVGYDHEEEAEAETMEGLEIEALARLGVGNPYRDAAA
jgi:probable rRNA maturation factor